MVARRVDVGRRRWWRELIDSFDGERTTVAEFCRRQGVSAASFYAWRKKLADESSAFVPVRVVESAGLDHEPARVHLTSGVRVDVPTNRPELLLELVKLLARPAEAEA